jgi:beta-lactamase superfamily II metal-dependent hydrolase
MRLLFVIPAALLLIAAYFVAETQTKTLEIYVADVEGGNATLIVSPSKESLLIDTGNLGAAARDAGRIMEAVNDAGLTQIDHLITTHWHLDHFGGMAELAGRIPVREFIDHGPNTQPNKKADAFFEQTYPSLYRNAKHTVVKAGDTIPIQDLNFTVVASAGETIKQSLPLAGTPNPYCANFKRADSDQTENAQSIGSYITFGKFRVLHLADLSSDKEFDLMCPDNRIGAVDLWVVSHHGQTNSNTEVLVHAIEPRVAIMNNGIRKGGEPEIMRIIHSAPGLEDLWQLHFSQLSGQEYTVPGMFIANLTDKPQRTVSVAPMTEPKPGTAHRAAPTHNGKAYWIKVSAQLDGSFTVTNARTSFSKVYRAQVE